MSQAVGFLDGEGCILISKRGTVSIEAEQVEPYPLYELQNEFGGRIRKLGGSRDGWRWTLAAKLDVSNALADIEVYSWGNKGRQATVALQFMNGNIELEQARAMLSDIKHHRPGKVTQ